jgi:acetyltransferase
MLHSDHAVAVAPALWRRRPEPRFMVRPIRPQDEAGLDAFYRGLSPNSRHRRFLAVVNEPPAHLLARFARPDRENEVALVATACDGQRETVVGEARFGRDEPSSNHAEFAIAVSDAAQGRGLGERLLRSLIRRARARRVGSLYGEVLPDNRAMLALARKFGFSERRSPADPRLLRVEMMLEPAQPA